jgi:hypothetical protein
MSFTLDDFVGPMIDVQEDVQGIGIITARKQGTLKWSFEDDDGVVDTFSFRNPTMCPTSRSDCFPLSIGRKQTHYEEHTVIRMAKGLRWSGTIRYETFP